MKESALRECARWPMSVSAIEFAPENIGPLGASHPYWLAPIETGTGKHAPKAQWSPLSGHPFTGYIGVVEASRVVGGALQRGTRLALR